MRLPPDASIADRRAHFVRISEDCLPLPDDLRISPASIGGVPGEWHDAGGETAGTVVLYLHGGGYAIGSSVTHRALTGGIARAAGSRVFSLDYRLAPEHRFPAAVEDAVAAYRGLLAAGWPPDAVFVAGDSAGGGLAAAVLVSLRDAGVPLPAGGVLISPWTDLELTGETLATNAAHDPFVQRESAGVSVRRYLGESGDPRHPLASPIHADLRGLPPLLIQVGLAETLLDDSRRLATRARAAGVEVSLSAYPDMIHIFPFFANRLREGRAAIDEIGAFIRARRPA
ncbi:MAG: alpha/beta hydrolase [Alphaproteobacteria bacterium]|nr:alpha/beta hydrolase [Alphaproteobacteria bacterium]